MKTAELVMLRTWRKPAKLFSDFNTLQFAAVTSLVVFIILLVFLVHAKPFHTGSVVDLPRVDHPVSMPSANREDAMVVYVLRDGKVYFVAEQVRPADLAEKIADRLRDRSVEKKIYFKVDMRADWRAVKPALNSVRSAGILRVAFPADQWKSAAFQM